MMFESHHEIFKVAAYFEEIDDWLPYAEDKVNQWMTLNDPAKFNSTFEIQLACLMLKDNLLPQSAIDGMALLVMESIHEAKEKKLRIDALKIQPPKPGRKAAEYISTALYEVHDLIKTGISKSVAYAEVAEKFHKAPDTIRREYERRMRHRQTRADDRGN